MKLKPTPGVMRFGAFEVDARTGELLKDGLRVRLPDQSFQVLLLLLEKPGELVSREALRNELWPEDTFVDFDHGLNAAVNRLREALGDSADHPKFIETLPRRGYRFIGVAGTHEERVPAESASAAVGDAVAASEHVEQPPSTTKAETAARSRLRKAGRVAAVLLVALCVLTLIFAVRRVMAPPQPQVLKSTQLTNDGKAKFTLLTDGRIVFRGN